jgi:hypothetical protein
MGIDAYLYGLLALLFMALGALGVTFWALLRYAEIDVTFDFEDEDADKDAPT